MMWIGSKVTVALNWKGMGTSLDTHSTSQITRNQREAPKVRDKHKSELNIEFSREAKNGTFQMVRVITKSELSVFKFSRMQCTYF